MSRYELDKVFHQIVLSEKMKEEYLADPATFLKGRNLNDEELQALHDRDFGALYAMGGHPFLLWGWAQRVSDDRGLPLLKKYTEAIQPHGFPSIAT